MGSSTRFLTHTRLPAALASVVLSAILAAPASALGAPIPPPPIASQSRLAGSAYLDSATRRVLELQQQITEARAAQVALDTRIAVTSRRILDQIARLDNANERLRAAQDAFDARAVAVYKSNERDELALLLDSHSFTEFVAHVSVLRRMLEFDRLTLEETEIVASEAQLEAGELEQLRQGDVALRDFKEQTERIVQVSLLEQQSLLAAMTAADRLVVDTQAREYRSTRARWKAASIPIGTVIHAAAGTVVDHPEYTYGVSEYHYRRYRSTGITFHAVSSWYGEDFNGRGTASGQTYNMDDFTCAHKTLPFGTWLAISRYDAATRSTRRIIVVVNDRGPYIQGRDIDLSRAAARALGMEGAGVGRVDVEIVTPLR